MEIRCINYFIIIFCMHTLNMVVKAYCCVTFSGQSRQFSAQFLALASTFSAVVYLVTLIIEKHRERAANIPAY